MKAVVNAAVAATTIVLSTLTAVTHTAQNPAHSPEHRSGTPATVATADGGVDPLCVACWE